MSRTSIKVCLVSVFPPPDCGIQHYTQQLAQSVQQFDPQYQISIIANERLTGFPQPQTTPAENLRVYRVWRRNTLTYPFKIARSVARENPRLVHVQYEYIMYGNPAFSVLFPLFLIFMRLLRHRTVVTMHSVVSTSNLSESFFKRRNMPKLLAFAARNGLKILTRFLCRFSQRVIVHTESAKKSLIKEYRIQPSKVTTIPHGIDPHKSNALIPVKMLPSLPQKLVGKDIVLSFGYITPSKGLEQLIEAMPEVLKSRQDTVLVIAGGLPAYHQIGGERQYLSKLKQLVKGANLLDAVVFTDGFVSEESAPTFFKAATIVVLPYLEDGVSGASGVLIEAARFGKPVVVTETTKFKGVIVDGVNGLLVTPESPSELSKAITTMLLNADLRFKLGQNLKRSFRTWTWQTVAKKTIEVYRSLG